MKSLDELLREAFERERIREEADPSIPVRRAAILKRLRRLSDSALKRLQPKSFQRAKRNAPKLLELASYIFRVQDPHLYRCRRPSPGSLSTRAPVRISKPTTVIAICAAKASSTGTTASCGTEGNTAKAQAPAPQLSRIRRLLTEQTGTYE